MKKTLLFLAFCVPFLVSSAQEQQGRMRDRIESALRTNYEKVNYDTLYLKRPDSKLTLKVRGNLSGTTITPSSMNTVVRIPHSSFNHATSSLIYKPIPVCDVMRPMGTPMPSGLFRIDFSGLICCSHRYLGVRRS